MTEVKDERRAIDYKLTIHGKRALISVPWFRVKERRSRAGAEKGGGLHGGEDTHRGR